MNLRKLEAALRSPILPSTTWHSEAIDVWQDQQDIIREAARERLNPDVDVATNRILDRIKMHRHLAYELAQAAVGWGFEPHDHEPNEYTCTGCDGTCCTGIGSNPCTCEPGDTDDH